MRRSAILTVLIAVLAGCGGSPAPRAAAPTPAPGPTMLLATTAGVEAVSARTGAVDYRVGGGIATADGYTIMATEGDRLVARDARTGAIRETATVGTGLVVSTVSPDGRYVALTTTPVSKDVPAGRTDTKLVVVHMGVDVHRYDLAGNLAPDAFNADGNSLFVVSYLPPEKPDRYQITSLALPSGQITGVFGWQKEALEDMRGRAGTRVLAPDGTTLYTLYLRPPAQPGGTTDDLRAEIHTLKLDQNWAHCVDLPAGFGGHDLSASTLAVSPSGTRLYVADRAQRQLVEIDADNLTITRTAALPLLSSSVPTSLVASDDGHLYVSDGPSVLVVDPSTLTVARRWPAGGPVTGLVAAGGGHGVLVSRPGHVDTFSPTAGETASMVVPADATAITRMLT